MFDDLFSRIPGERAPGYAARVLDREGNVLYEGCFGRADTASGERITQDTVFHVASVSKQFTSWCVTLLEERGLLSAADPVRRYLPWLPEMLSDVTVAHLMSHTGGLREHWDLFQWSGNSMEDVVTRGHMLRLTGNQRGRNFTAGAEHLYCNSGYLLLGEIVREISGRTLREFAAREIFGPLGMDRSFFRDRHGEADEGRAKSYVPRGDGYEEYLLSFDITGPTGLNTTARDLGKWLGNWRKPVSGTAETVRRMTAPVLLNDGTEIAYRRGVTCFDLRGHAVRQHTGVNAGYRAAVVSTDGYDVIVLSNYAWSYPVLKAYAILGRLYGDERPVGEAFLKAEDAPVRDGLYRSGCSLAKIRREPGGDVLFTQDGFTMRFERSEGNLYRCAATLCELYTDEGGVTLYASRDGARYEPLPEGAPDGALFDGLDGRWYSPELETVWTASHDGNGVYLDHMKAGRMAFIPAGGNEFIRADKSGVVLRIGPGRIELVSDRTYGVRFVKM